MSKNEHPIFEKQKGTQPSPDQPALYRIYVKGNLPKHWSTRLGCMDIIHQIQEDGSMITRLEGRLVDQATLIGMLVTIYSQGFLLISVEYLGPVRKAGEDVLKVSVRQKDTYLEFIVTGTYDLDTAVGKFPLVITACRQTEISHALIDYRQLGGEKMATQELLYAHRVGEFYQEHLAHGGQPLKIAFVGDESLPDTIGQAIGKTYGLESLITNNYQAAVDWLCAEK